MKLKFTRKTWYFFLLAAAAVSMLGGFAVLGGMDFSALELVAFCLTGIAALFLAAQKGAPAAEKRNYTLVFVLLMLSKLAAGGWAGDLCSALVWPALLGIEYSRGKPIQRQLQLVCAAEVLRTVFWLLTRYAGMAGLAFWTNLLFVLLACARGWAALTLYKLHSNRYTFYRCNSDHHIVQLPFSSIVSPISHDQLLEHPLRYFHIQHNVLSSHFLHFPSYANLRDEYVCSFRN